jgi:hypothetical protein
MGRWGDGATAAATKWLNRITQGFSPGYDSHCGCALKGRPNSADAGCNSDTTQNSITPCAGFEDEDKGPHEGARARRTKKKRPEVRALLEVRIMS